LENAKARYLSLNRIDLDAMINGICDILVMDSQTKECER